MHIELLTIGDELLDGLVVDGNTAYIGRQLDGLGLRVARRVTLRDDSAEIAEALRGAAARADVCIVTGGLGPTADDLTVDALAAAAGVRTTHDARAWAHIETIYGDRTPPAMNRRQARRPEGGRLLYSEVGTAPGVELQVGACTVFVLPGVPREMRWHMGRYVLPALCDRLPAARAHTRILQFACIGESSLAERVDRQPLPAGVSLAWCALDSEIQVRVRAPDAETLECASALVIAAAPARYVGRDGDGVVEAVLAACRARGLTLGAAESCTGGLIGAGLTTVPGSSDVFVGSVVSYANAVKQNVLGVPAEVLVEHGAVSEACARAMAEGARRVLGADVAVAVTGIAGPGGATPGKPVGTVCFGWAGAGLDGTRTLQLRGDRDRVRRHAVTYALDVVRRGLVGASDDLPT